MNYVYCICFVLFCIYYIYYRTDIQCREKWKNALDPTIKHVEPFTKSEDGLLLKLLPVYGLRNWTQLSTWFIGRTDAQCMIRYKQLVP